MIKTVILKDVFREDVFQDDGNKLRFLESAGQKFDRFYFHLMSVLQGGRRRDKEPG